MSKGLLLFALLIVLAALSARAVVKIMEPRYLFHPASALRLNPSLVGLDYKDVFIKSGPYTIHGWYIPADGEALGFIVFFHGATGNISDRLDFIRFIRPLKLHVLMIDYRGYGRSGGYPTIDGIEEDAIAAVGWLTGRLKAPQDRVFVWGRSLGAAAAVAAAERYPGVAGVIIESGFASLRGIAVDIEPRIPVAFVSDAFKNADVLSRLSTPKLFIHGMEDTFIPFRHSEEMFHKAAEPKRILPVRGAGHNDTHIKGGRAYLRAVKEWMIESMRRQQ